MSDIERPLKVFLFHAPADRAAVRNLYLRLIQDGVDAWIVKEKLLPGRDWKQELHNAFREADVVVVCISRRFDQEEFRQKEVRLALDKVVQEYEIFVIPVLLEECAIPESLSEWQTVKLLEEAGYEVLLQILHTRANTVGATMQSRESSLPQAITANAEDKQPIAEEASVKALQGVPGILEGAGILIEGNTGKRHSPARATIFALLGFAAIVIMAWFGPSWIESSQPLTVTPENETTQTSAPAAEINPGGTSRLKPIPALTRKGSISHIVFLIDTSGSMRGQRIRNVKSAASEFVSRLGDDYLISIIEFNTNVKLRMAATRDLGFAYETIQSITVDVPHNGACVYDAFYAGIQQASLAPVISDTETIIILLTDVAVGENVGWNCGMRLMDDFLSLVWNLPIPIFSIYVGDEFDPNSFLTWPAGEGAMFAAKDDDEIDSWLLMISEAAGLQVNSESRTPARTTDASLTSMVFVPPGEFIMGDNTVYLDAFWIDKTEVTNAMFARCVRAGHCMGPRSSRSNTTEIYFGNTEFENYPVIYVSWEDANIYCAWARGRLPTEAEWEKAARGTDGRQYPWGDEDPTEGDDLLNFRTLDTTEVGSYPNGASPYGALDMAGNVSEWVADWLSVEDYENPPAINPLGPDSGEYRVWRGGSWATTSVERVRTYSRTGNFPTDSSGGIGFRCARDGEP
ncbi:MAG TPA: SUMF1/EgtB/PvdO family nonheme iron enzyme [Anaerolineales bacterium]|nr:SUMF1/EgtB/PvdO family nonheme iron enzyme [Anaerolineales bacterium]